jgi:hypothetical protein
MARTQYTPGLFEVAHDVGGSLPIALIEAWLESDQTHEDALALLGPHRVVGYNVVSDSTGLTGLTQQLGLLEILAVINQPKEIVHRVGAAIGGEAVGVWAADNTQMFFPDDVDAATLVSALLTIQDEVAARCRIRIGLGAHHGAFYSLAGGLHGEASDGIEEFTEHATQGGEVAISAAVSARLIGDHGFRLAARAGSWYALGSASTVLDGPRHAAASERRGRYPIPYSEAFYADLLALAADLDDAALARRLTDRYTRESTVVLVERERELADSHEVALLTDLALTVMMKDAGLRHLDAAHGEEIKVAGGVGVYAFDDGARALAFAEAFRRELSGDGILCRVGVDRGPVLVFELAHGGRDIAGEAVNVAARLAQDRGAWGKLYLSDRVYEQVDVRGFQPITCTISGVEVHAFEG